MAYSGPVRRPGDPDGQRHQALHEAEGRYRCRQEDRDHPQGHRADAPEVATRLAQELITRDNVDILAGFTLSPNAIAVSKVSAEAKKFMVIMNAATTVIITMSPYSVRTSVTLPLGRLDRRHLGLQERHPQGLHDGVRLRPGQGRRGRFPRGLQEGGRRDHRLGAACRSVNPDFSAFVQKAKDINPESIFMFIPAGAQPAALGKAFAERGIDAKKVKIIGTGEVGDEASLKGMGDAGLGIITRLALRLERPIQHEQGVREGLQRRVQAQSRLRRGRRL